MNNTLGRLQDVINQIENEDLKNIIEKVFQVEIDFRSYDSRDKPKQKIKEIINDAARIIEIKTKTDEPAAD